MQCCFKDLQVFGISKTPSLKWGREKAVLTLAPSVLTMKVRVQWPLSNCTCFDSDCVQQSPLISFHHPPNAHPAAFSFHIQLLLLNILRHHYCKLNAKIAKSFMSIFKHPLLLKPDLCYIFRHDRHIFERYEKYGRDQEQSKSEVKNGQNTGQSQRSINARTEVSHTK